MPFSEGQLQEAGVVVAIAVADCRNDGWRLAIRSEGGVQRIAGEGPAEQKLAGVRDGGPGIERVIRKHEAVAVGVVGVTRDESGGATCKAGHTGATVG